MNTMQWRHTDWVGRNFIFWLNEKVVGQLTFKNSWNLNAIYRSEQNQLKFVVSGFWKTKVKVFKNDDLIGEIETHFYGKQTLKLSNGKSYSLTSGFWGRNTQWADSKGETLIKYTTAYLRSMGKGTITISDKLAPDEKDLLVSSGLFARQLFLKMAAVVVIVMASALSTTPRI
jgi:hypothetical protein